MAGVGAAYQATALLESPRLAAAMRAQPLPDDVLVLIRIAAGDEAVLADLAAGRPGLRPARLREAAVLYLQNVLFAPGSDLYRVLGVAPDAPQPVVREHVAWLMKWLHPDRPGGGWESVFASRVTAAWNEMKTAEKRAAYDAVRSKDAIGPLTRSGRRRVLHRPPRVAPLILRSRSRNRSRKLRAVRYAVAGALAAAVVLAPAVRVPQPAADEAPTSTAGDGF